MYSLLSIFIIIPLIYSHTFARLGEVFVIENGIGNFESVKVSIFFLLLFLSTVEFLLEKKEFLSRKTSLIGLTLIAFVILEFFLFGPESVFGIGEKQHGSLFFAGLLWVWYLTTYIEKKELPRFHLAIVATGIVIACVALIEFLFRYNIFTGYSEGLSQTWGEHRATSTLGNPNYVAGYLLMITPFLHTLKKGWQKYGAFLIIFLGILSTGSFIGMTLFCFYGIYLILRRYAKKYALSLLSLIVILSLVILTKEIMATEKWLSLVSRFVLMKETLLTSFGDFSSFFLGNGPNGIILSYEGTRSEAVMNYFPSNMIIDSSHNIFVDIFVKFGIFPFIFLIYRIKRNGKSLESWQKHGILLSFFFLSLNVVILSHYLVFCMYLTRDKQRL